MKTYKGWSRAEEGGKFILYRYLLQIRNIELKIKAMLCPANQYDNEQRPNKGLSVEIW